MKNPTGYHHTILRLVLITVIYAMNPAHAQTQPSLTKQQAAEDFGWLRFALEYVHPRLYKYEDKKIVDNRFDSLTRSIANEISTLDFLALVSVANASVRCGHLYTIPQSALADTISGRKVLPFHIKLLGDRFYILNDCSDAAISNGSEIIKINGRTGNEILSAIWPGIAVDGFIQTRKARLAERYFNETFHGFDLYYYLHVDRSKSFEVEYVDYRSKKVKTVFVEGVTSKKRSERQLSMYGVDDKSWFTTPSPRFEIDKTNTYALLTVSRSFHDKSVDPEFKTFLESVFLRIKQNHIQNLILDLRNNEGGDERQQMELISYLYNRPFKLYENIYLSHLDFRPLKDIIIERDTSMLVFNNDDKYMRKVNENLWINNYEYSDNLQFQAPKKNVFNGKLYVLINGATFSSASDLAADLNRTRKAYFIGEESGGAYEGPTGGDNIVIQLPNSKIMIRISPNIQTGYMYQKHPIGRGVLPSYNVTYTIDDIVAGRDLDLDLAKKLIRKSGR